jgi:4-hydroxybenzoate polyprenyltransferase
MLPVLRAAHFQPTVAVTAITAVLALAAGRGAGTVWVLLAVLAGQLSVGWSNDYVDRCRDRAAGRTDKPIAAGQVAATTVWRLALAAVAAAILLSWLSGRRAALVHIVAIALAWAYNFGVKATPLSPLPFALAFGSLPAFVTLGLPGHPLPPGWAMTAAALLGAGAHFVNAVPDLAADAQAGVRGLPHRLGAEPSLIVAAALLAGAVTVLTFGPSGGLGVLAAVLFATALGVTGAIAVVASTGHGRAAWTLTLVAALLAVGLFLARGAALAG